jgi:hypothetical protein
MLTIPATLNGSIWSPESTIPPDALEVWLSSGNYNVLEKSDVYTVPPTSILNPITKVASAPFVVPDGSAGMHYNFTLNYGFPLPLVTDMLRLHDIAFELQRGHWKGIHTANGVFDWTFIDRVVNFYADRVQLIYVICVTPTWASARPLESGAYAPGSAAEPSNFSYFTDFLEAFGTRYAGKIKYYEIWNEPNGTAFYTGTHAQLSQMCRLASQTLKAIDPEIQIISPPVTAIHTGGSGITYFNALCAASDGDGGVAKDWWDIISCHSYPSISTQSLIQSPQIAKDFKAAVVAQGLDDKELWQTEYGLLSPDSPTLGSGRLKYVWYNYLSCMANGFDKWFFYTYDNTLTGLSDDPELADEYNQFINFIKGKTISALNVWNGRMYAVIDGQRYVI